MGKNVIMLGEMGILATDAVIGDRLILSTTSCLKARVVSSVLFLRMM